jgi:deferrochelatase/peroxidase EfeB
VTPTESDPGTLGPRSPDDRGLWRARMTRRAALAGTAVAGAGAGLDRLLGSSAAAAATSAGDPLLGAVPFHGPRQAGIATPQQSHLAFAAFDVTGSSRAALRGLLQRWTDAAAALTAGREASLSGAVHDSGEAVGLPPARLTLTFGLGPTLFESGGRDRFGLAHLRPALLEPLPPFAGELLDPASSGGDLCVQACANDPQVAFHAIHQLARVAGSAATLRWMQRGFWPSDTTPAGSTPRNLLGFKDGTANIRGDDEAALNRFVWVQPGDRPGWMSGGSYLVARRIELVLESWDPLPLARQERAVGRHKASGAPLGARGEHDPVDLRATDAHGRPVVPVDAHVRVASAAANNGIRILRRGYSYSGGVRPGASDRGGHELDSGLFFIAFVRDPARQFIPLQRRLATGDALSMFSVHTASAIFAIPPGAAQGHFVGEQLFA